MMRGDGSMMQGGGRVVGSNPGRKLLIALLLLFVIAGIIGFFVYLLKSGTSASTDGTQGSTDGTQGSTDGTQGSTNNAQGSTDGASKANIVSEQGNVKLAAGCTAKEAQGRKCSGWCVRNSSNGRIECNSSNDKGEFWTIQKIKEDEDRFTMKLKHNNSNKWCQWVADDGWRIICNADSKGATSFHLDDKGVTKNIGNNTWAHDLKSSAFDKVDIMKQPPGTFALLDTNDTSCKTSHSGAHNISRSSKDRVNIMKQCEGTPAAQTVGWNTWSTDVQ